MSLTRHPSDGSSPKVDLTQPRLLAPGDGDHIAFLGTIMTVKAGGGSHRTQPQRHRVPRAGRVRTAPAPPRPRG